MAKPIVFYVHEEAVASYTQPFGDVDRFIRNILRETKRLAQFKAPVRKGTLKRSIFIAFPQPTGYLQERGRVVANAKHALWVHEGTRSVIRAKGGKPMLVPRSPHAMLRGAVLINMQAGRSLVSKRKTVRGQRANPFLQEALRGAVWANGLKITRG